MGTGCIKGLQGLLLCSAEGLSGLGGMQFCNRPIQSCLPVVVGDSIQSWACSGCLHV